MNDKFINKHPKSFTKFTKDMVVDKIELIDNKEYIRLNISNELNFDYDDLLDLNKENFHKNINDCFFDLNQDFLFTQPVLIPIIGVEEEKDNEFL